MSDIFISYSRQDRARAEALASELDLWNVTLWWDRSILPSQRFDRAIEEAIMMSSAVVVLWSRTSVASDYVRSEALAAAEQHKLVPVLVDDVEIPLRFRLAQAADLRGWDGSRIWGVKDLTTPHAQQLMALVVSIFRLLGRTIDPDRAQGYVEFGWKLLGEQRLDHQQLLNVVEASLKAIQAFPVIGSAYVNLGTALGRLGRYAEAEKALKKSLFIDGPISTTYHNLGSALRELGRETEATDAFNRAKELEKLGR